MNRPLHVVIVDEGLPYPPNSGKRIRSYNLVSRLASRHRITYLCHRNNNSTEAVQAEERFRSLGIETVLADHSVPQQSGPGFYGRLLLNLFSSLPYSVMIHNSPEMLKAIHDYGSTHQPHLWQCEWTPYAETARCAGMAPRVVMAHNIESLIWRRSFENEANPLKRWYIKHQWRKFERFERRVLRDAAQMITVSEVDAVLARDRFGVREVSVVDNGVDVEYFHPRPGLPRSKAILFLGSLFWRPNLDAVKLLLDRIFPAVLSQEPSARLQIVGRRPPKWLPGLVQRCPNAELHADVADVRPFLWQCGVMAVPLRIGGGSRLKILEALACDCPVVSTRIGAEGLRLRSGVHFVEVQGIQDMAGMLVGALRDPLRSLTLARAGRQAVRSLYDWDTLADKLDDIWTEQAFRRAAL